MAPDGTAMMARVRAVAPYQVLEAVVKPPGAPPAPPVELARSGAGGSMLPAGGVCRADGRFAITYDESECHQVTLAPDGRRDRQVRQPARRHELRARTGADPRRSWRGELRGGRERRGWGRRDRRVPDRRAGAGKVLPIPSSAGDRPDRHSATNRTLVTPRRMAGCCVIYTMGGRTPGGRELRRW